jgi:23S rRNA (adenine2503-C2)-methyltransferase
VVQAIDVISDQRGLDIALRHITLSTVGLPDGIRRLAALGRPQLKLAVSLNASNDALRSRLMPVNRRFPMDSLKAALHHYPLARGNAIFMEYVLIKGVNDHPRFAAELAAFFQDLDVKLNLIACNPGGGSPFEASAEEDLERFHQALIDQRIFVRRRSSKGAGIRAACGQLG